MSRQPTDPNQNITAFPFLGMPLELRQEVYDLVVVQNGPVDPFSEFSRAACNVFLSNRQIGEEASDWYYSRNRFEFPQCFKLKEGQIVALDPWVDLARFLTQMSDRNRNALRRIEICLPPVADGHWKVDSGLSPEEVEEYLNDKFLRVLGLLRAAPRLTIRLRVDWYLIWGVMTDMDEVVRLLDKVYRDAGHGVIFVLLHEHLACCDLNDEDVQRIFGGHGWAFEVVKYRHLGTEDFRILPTPSTTLSSFK